MDQSNLKKVPVLDHGYLALVEKWGSDESIIEAARMSTGKGFLGWGPKCECGVLQKEQENSADGYVCAKFPQHIWGPGDEKLLKYLWDNKHTTPFETPGMTIEVQAPIMVFREWHRHRTQSYSEMSARYTPLPDVNYIPSTERLMLNSKTNRQAGTIKGSAELTPEGANRYRIDLGEMYEDQERLYQNSLLMGVPKELARLHLPVGRYSRMRATANLWNWLRFLLLRMSEGAQYEIRMFANEVGNLVKECYPRTWELFNGDK